MSAADTRARSGPDALVIGVGNVLWADEGFGVRCAEAFAAQFAEVPEVEVMDGGTQGLSLINPIAEAKRVLIFDAVDAHLEPGALITVRGADVPKFVAAKKVSLHQTSMMEVLALAEFMGGGAPEAITLIGCQPVELEDYGGGLTGPVAAQVEPALGLAVEELTAWGLAPRVRTTPADPGSVMPAAVTRDAYEGARPGPDAACRIGDPRVLARRVAAQAKTAAE